MLQSWGIMLFYRYTMKHVARSLHVDTMSRMASCCDTSKNAMNAGSFFEANHPKHHENHKAPSWCFFLVPQKLFHRKNLRESLCAI
jgi:hypothetical protein